MRKLFFINRFYWPDKSATAQILTDLTRNLDLAGSEICVITSRNLYIVSGDKLPKNEMIEGVKIYRAWSTNFGRSSIIGRSLDYLSFYLGAFVSMMRFVHRGDVVVAKTDPPLISFVAYLVAKIKNAFLVNWIQDLFPEVAGALNVLKKESFSYKIFKWMKDRSLKAAIMNVVIGEKMANLLVQQGVEKSKIRIVHNWNINTQARYIPKESNPLIREWGVEGKFVIGYSGNFGRAHEYQIIEEAVGSLKHYKSIIFVFIGGGKYYDTLQKYVDLNQIDNVLFKPYQSIEMLNYSLSVPDLHLISLNPELEGFIVPSKFYGLASIGVPVIFIGAEDGEIGNLLKSNGCGFVVGRDQSDELLAIIRSILAKKINLQNIGDKLKQLHGQRFVPAVAYRKMESCLTERLVHGD